MSFFDAFPMTHYRLARTAPHLYIHVGDDLTEWALGRALLGLYDDVHRLPARATVHIESAEHVTLPISATGVMHYYLALLFDSEPSLVVFSCASRVMRESMEGLIARLNHRRRAHFVSSHAEAESLLRTHRLAQRQALPLPPGVVPPVPTAA